MSSTPSAEAPLFRACFNTEAFPLRELPLVPFAELAAAIVEAVPRQARLAALFGLPPEPGSERLRLVAVLARPELGRFDVSSTEVGREFPSLSPACPAAQLFERELAEQWGVVPVGHPWLKPVRFHTAADGSRPEPAVGDFYRVEGDEVHEVAVGPVHAGVIEPGHFRFQCHGEKVFHLEIALGYQHRGIERALRGGPHRRSLALAETLAGDTSIGHATAYCQILEALGNHEPPARAQSLRAIALELERLANHTGDLGALAGDVGYLPTASYCGRIRGDFLNLSALLCGSRFGRALVQPGGVAFDLDAARAASLRERLDAVFADATNAIELIWKTPSVMARFDGTGCVSRADAEAIGLVGPAARACGLEIDARAEFPSGAYRFAHIPVSFWESGDVLARAHVRWLEMQRSVQFIRDQVHELPASALRAELGPLVPEHLALIVVEGWRGELVHVALTDAKGRFSAYKVVDPSFHNWNGLALALRNEAISDFPLCNKSFNLSYCGFDL